jgi:hypothetical protein
VSPRELVHKNKNKKKKKKQNKKKKIKKKKKLNRHHRARSTSPTPASGTFAERHSVTMPATLTKAVTARRPLAAFVLTSRPRLETDLESHPLTPTREAVVARATPSSMYVPEARLPAVSALALA